VGDGVYNKLVSQQFSNLFNCYAKSFNKVYNRKAVFLFLNLKEKKSLRRNIYSKLLFIFTTTL